MIITFTNKNEDGSTDFALQLTNQELDFLVNLGMGILLNTGALAVDSSLLGQPQTATLQDVDTEQAAGDADPAATPFVHTSKLVN